MSRKFLTAIDLAQNELQNAKVQNLAGAPSSPVKGQLYYNSTAGNDTLYWWDGTQWQSAKGGGTGFPGYGPVTAETTFGTSKNDGASTSVARADHQHGNPAHDAAAHATIRLSDLAAPISDISMNGQKLINVGAPVSAGDAANKVYVDNAITGLSWKNPVEAATTANIALTGTGQVIDGYTVVANARILVKNQTDATTNGIYTAASGAWARSTDNDTFNEMVNASVFVKQGTVNADTSWVCTVDPGGAIGSSNLPWVQFAGTGTVTAGAGMTQSGNTLNVIAANGSIVVGSDDVQVGYAGSGSNIYGLPTGQNYGVSLLPARADHTHLGYFARQYVNATVGGSTSQVFNHQLGARYVDVQVYRNAAPYDTVECDVERTDANNITLRFAVAPAANEYSVVVVGP